MLMAGGALMLLAGKLHLPSLGSGASPLDILRGIGLVALACLGVTIEIDDLPLSVFPLGVLSVVVLFGARFARDAFASRPMDWNDVLRVSVALAFFCTLGALVFRFSGEVPVRASLPGSAASGFLWGGVIAIGGLMLRRGERPAVRWLEVPGVDQAWLTTKAAAAATTLATLALIAGRLAVEALPRAFGLGDAVASIIYLLAFFPNVLVAVFSLSVGATITIGAQVNAGGRVIGPLRELSIWDWGNGDPPTLVLLLVLVPLVVFTGAGVWAARRYVSPRSIAVTLGIAGLLLGLSVMLLASLGDARLGAGLVRREGVGLVTVDAFQAGLLTSLWCITAGALGAAAHSWRRS